MSFFGGGGGGKKKNANPKSRLHDVQFTAIKDTLRKKNKEKKMAAETVVMEW